MKVLINSRMRLTPIGWIGTVLFVLAPLVGTWAYVSAIESAARAIRYGGVPTNPGAAFWTVAIAGAFSLAGLVMVIAGRSYLHEVETKQ